MKKAPSRRDDAGDSFDRREGATAVPRHDLEVLSPKQTNYAVVVPVWNEGERFESQLASMSLYTNVCDIVISDAPSTDGSTDTAKLRAAGVHALVTLQEGRGLSSSLRAALDFVLRSGFDGVILMDGNGKDDPADLVRFVRELESGADYAQGSRYIAGGRAINTPLHRTLLIRLLHAPIFSLLCGRWFTDTTIGSRSFSRRFLLDPRVKPFRDVFRYYDLYFYLAWAACRHDFRVADVPVTRAYPAGGPLPTKISLFRGHWRMLKPLLMILFRRY